MPNGNDTRDEGLHDSRRNRWLPGRTTCRCGSDAQGDEAIREAWEDYSIIDSVYTAPTSSLLKMQCTLPGVLRSRPDLDETIKWSRRIDQSFGHSGCP
jgi:hypothetical protein